MHGLAKGLFFGELASGLCVAWTFTDVPTLTHNVDKERAASTFVVACSSADAKNGASEPSNKRSRDASRDSGRRGVDQSKESSLASSAHHKSGHTTRKRKQTCVQVLRGAGLIDEVGIAEPPYELTGCTARLPDGSWVYCSVPTSKGRSFYVRYKGVVDKAEAWKFFDEWGRYNAPDIAMYTGKKELIGVYFYGTLSSRPIAVHPWIRATWEGPATPEEHRGQLIRLRSGRWYRVLQFDAEAYTDWLQAWSCLGKKDPSLIAMYEKLRRVCKELQTPENTILLLIPRCYFIPLPDYRGLQAYTLDRIDREVHWQRESLSQFGVALSDKPRGVLLGKLRTTLGERGTVRAVLLPPESSTPQKRRSTSVRVSDIATTTTEDCQDLSSGLPSGTTAASPTTAGSAQRGDPATTARHNSISTSVAAVQPLKA